MFCGHCVRPCRKLIEEAAKEAEQNQLRGEEGAGSLAREAEELIQKAVEQSDGGAAAVVFESGAVGDGRAMARPMEFTSMARAPARVRLTPRASRVPRATEEENSWTLRQKHWKNIKDQLAAQAAQKVAQQREKPLTLIGGGEKPFLPPLPASLERAQLPAKEGAKPCGEGAEEVEQIQSTYHWRPCQIREHCYAADLPGHTLGTYVNTMSFTLPKETLQARGLALERGSTRSMASALLLLTLFALLQRTAGLERVVLVSRHGERERLIKDQLTQEESEGGGPPLTARGAADAAAVGRALRQRYVRPGGCSQRCLGGEVGATGNYQPGEVHCESSALARTLQSAYALQEGLFPGGSVAEAAPAVPLPVYSRPTGEDFILRGYTKCSVQAQKLKDWYSSPEFQAKATDTKAFRSQMAEALGRVNVTEDGTAAPLADAGTQRAERLAAWLEAKKFSPQIAGTSCGGALLSAIGEQLDLSKDPKLRLVHYSAHYATMLCLMSALGLLGLSSLLAFELEELPTGEMVIGLHYWPGSDSFSSSWRTVELPCVSGKCTEKQFQSLVSVGGQPSRTAWCEACQSFQLPLCAAPAPRGRLAHQRWDLPAFAFVFLGIGLAALGAAGCYAFRRSWRSCFFSEEESRSMMADRGTGNAIGAGKAPEKVVT
eukprot:g7504.t3